MARIPPVKVRLEIEPTVMASHVPIKGTYGTTIDMVVPLRKRAVFPGRKEWLRVVIASGLLVLGGVLGYIGLVDVARVPLGIGIGLTIPGLWDSAQEWRRRRGS